MPYIARHPDPINDMKSLSKIGMMRQIATGIYHADGLLFPEMCKVKTTVDRIELLARWTGTESPPLHIRKQTLMGCGSLLYHLKQSYASQGWSVEVRLFPKLDREDVIAYVRAGIRNIPFYTEIPPADAVSPDQPISDGSVIIEKKVHEEGDDAGISWYFRTKDNDAIAWIRTGQACARLFRTIKHAGKISTIIPDPEDAASKIDGWVNQLIVSVRD
jgi:hypothetical protein